MLKQFANLLANLPLSADTQRAITMLGPVRDCAPQLGDRWRDPTGIIHEMIRCDCGCGEAMTERVANGSRGWGWADPNTWTWVAGPEGAQ